MQADVGVAEAGEQVVVEPTDGTRRVAVAHRRGDRRAVDVAQRRAQLVERGDAELEEQAGDPRVVLGARPSGAGVPAGEERRELGGADPRVECVLRADAARAQPGLEAVADGPELPVRQLEQAGREGEPPVEVGDLLRRHRALVADVVLELGPGVLEHGAQLDRGAGDRVVPGGADRSRDEQVPARVAETSCGGGLLAEVAVVEDGELLGQQVGDGVDVTLNVGDDPHPHLVGHGAHRVGGRVGGQDPARLAGERLDRLGPPGDAEVVDPGVVDDAGDELDDLVGGGQERRPQGGVVGHGSVDAAHGHGPHCPTTRAGACRPPAPHHGRRRRGHLDVGRLDPLDALTLSPPGCGRARPASARADAARSASGRVPPRAAAARGPGPVGAAGTGLRATRSAHPR